MANDFLHTPEKDLLIVNGDFAVGEATEQLIENLLLAHQGEYKEYPLAGVGIRLFGNGPWDYKTVKQLEKRIRLQLQYDGAEKIDVSIKDQQIKIDARY